MSVLCVKFEESFSQEDLLRLDELCQGLMGLADHYSKKKFFSFSDEPIGEIKPEDDPYELTLLIPSHASLEAVFVFSGFSDFPWDRLKEAVGAQDCIYWAGSFEPQELQAAKKVCSQLKSWTEIKVDFAPA